MITYTFDKLSSRGRDYAREKYGSEEIVKDKILDIALTLPYKDVPIGDYALTLLGWRFTEHGERIA